MSSSRLLVFFFDSPAPLSSLSGGITSSANSIVSMASTPSRGRMATRFSFERRTTRAIATLAEASIASTRSL